MTSTNSILLQLLMKMESSTNGKKIIQLFRKWSLIIIVALNLLALTAVIFGAMDYYGSNFKTKGEPPVNTNYVSR